MYRLVILSDPDDDMSVRCDPGQADAGSLHAGRVRLLLFRRCDIRIYLSPHTKSTCQKSGAGITVVVSAGSVL